MAFPFRFRMSTLGMEVVREYVVSFPVDWFDVVLTDGPLPVVAFLHGPGETASEFLDDTFRISEWWEGFPGGVLTPLPKAIAFAPQGLAVHAQEGGDWNAGNLGRSLRLIGVDDVTFFFEALDQLERFMLDGYKNDIQPVTQGADMTQVFDRTRLMLVGFSSGGQMAYRLVVEAAARGWTVTAVAVFGASIGGWHRGVDRTLGLAPNVEWAPTTVIPFLLHVHGRGDDQIEPDVDGMSNGTSDMVTPQVGMGQADQYGRADISGENSVVAYVDAATTALWTSVMGIAGPIIPVPHQLTVLETYLTPAGAAAGLVVDAQITFALVGGVPLLGHEVPVWAPGIVAQFFRAWGKL